MDGRHSPKLLKPSVVAAHTQGSKGDCTGRPVQNESLFQMQNGEAKT